MAALSTGQYSDWLLYCNKYQRAWPLTRERTLNIDCCHSLLTVISLRTIVFLSFDNQIIYILQQSKLHKTLTYCISCFILLCKHRDLKQKEISHWTYSLFCDFRLVMSDLAFYSGTFKTLRGLESLAQDTNDVWDIRWQRFSQSVVASLCAINKPWAFRGIKLALFTHLPCVLFIEDCAVLCILWNVYFPSLWFK